MCSLYFPMKRYSFCITFSTTAYSTSDTTIIHHVYKPDFSSLRSYFLDRKLRPVCHQIGGRVRSSFLSGQWLRCLTNYWTNYYRCMILSWAYSTTTGDAFSILIYSVCTVALFRGFILPIMSTTLHLANCQSWHQNGRHFPIITNLVVQFLFRRRCVLYN